MEILLSRSKRLEERLIPPDPQIRPFIPKADKTGTHTFGKTTFHDMSNSESVSSNQLGLAAVLRLAVDSN
jgi:hypothetical protein